MSLEPLIKVLLASIADTHPDRLDFDAVEDEFRGVFQAHARQALSNTRAELLVEQTAQVGRLSTDFCRHRPERDRVRIVRLNLLEHLSYEIVRHGNPRNGFL